MLFAENCNVVLNREKICDIIIQLRTQAHNTRGIDMKRELFRKNLANSAIGVMFVVSLVVFAASFLPMPRLHDFIFNYVEINRWVQRLISLALLFIAWHLYMRKRVVWTVCVLLLSASFILHFVLLHHPINIVIVVLEAYALAALLICYNDFRRPLHGLSKAKNMSAKAKACLRELVVKYGQNSSSYLALEDDKMLFTGKDVDGVVAYGVVGNVVTVCGDPICAPDDFIRFLAEFKAFCAECSYQCIFLGTSDVFLKQYTMLGYSHVKSGEEAKFLLSQYELKGGKMAKLRALINHANKEVTTHEYKPNDERDEGIEKGINAVSEAWLEGKKSGQLGFSVGGVGLEDPLDRRYFYAVDADGKIVGFNVFLPFDNKNGYMADVTRRIPHAPGGITEKLVYDGFMAFKEEGAQWGSMGLAPLANVHEEGVKDDMTVKLLEFIYEKCNSFYGFKDLHHAKEKYSPTVWAPGYFVYSSKNITPEMAFASVKIQNPGGISDYLLSSLKVKFK